ncbi:hypothetical protein [Streptomyces sp. NBC_00102]|uniref:hypothetical protein n=1 Tax=Streptomyces sp. NBC_00102 TaxID=2975652 RepID=UPI0022567F67|nr:hypothetical protein [Streptomyces sp. NBC_00102]MCX5398673.1 hypothetical protein [Streptomyces sp. NBC_00102]
MRSSGDAGPAVLGELRSAAAAHPLVNLTGPLGVGKSALTAGLPGAARVDLDRPDGPAALRRALSEPAGPTLVVDSVDGRARRNTLYAELEHPDHRWPTLVVVSRRPLLSDPRWTHSGAATVAVAPSEERIAAQAAPVADPDGRAVVVQLAGGIPLIADAARRALDTGIPPTALGAVADQVTEEILERLGRELPGRQWRHALRLLATVGSGDERLLPGGPDHFSSLASLSVVERDRLGLRITEPFRTLFELAYRWRRPESHESARIRARDYRLALLAGARDPAERAALAEQGLFLSAGPLVRRTLFPADARAVRVRSAVAADAADIGGLMRQWAVHSGFDPRRCDRLTERWAGDDISSFHLVYDRDDRAIGIAGLMPIDERTSTGMEPLLQQHSAAAAAGGHFLGAAHCPDPAVRAILLRHLLQHASGGPLVVSTANPEYQGLVNSLGFRVHGSIRDDVFHCGRPPAVYSNDFSAAALPWWLGRLNAEGNGNPPRPPARPVPRIAPKELQVLLDYVSGMTLKSAARRAGITPNTAKDYLNRVKSKYRLAGRPAYTKIDLAHRVHEDGLGPVAPETSTPQIEPYRGTR